MLLGNHIRLRAIEREDIPTFLRWFNDPEVREGLLIYAPMGRVEEERWFENTVGRTDQYLFAIEAMIEEEARWVHIGNVSLAHIDWKNRACIFGIALGEKTYWNRGFGTEATRTMLRFAFEQLNLHRVELEVFAFNERAAHAYEKAGFRREGTRRKILYQNGQYHDAHIMSILQEEFSQDHVPGSK
jgi:diamine N-acetyltransferase